MTKIYGLLTPNVLKPIITAEELLIHYEHVNVDLSKKQNRTAEHLARHPFGMIPVLEHEGRYLWESNAICRYLANFIETSLYPRDPWARSQVDQWIDFASNHVGRSVTQVFVQRCVVSQVFKQPVNESKILENEKLLLDQMPSLEKHLNGKRYLTGDTFTLADIVLFSLTCTYKTAGINFSDHKAFELWFGSIKGRPSVQKLIPKLPFPYIQ